jgi:arsenite-transporting ATPase
MLLEPDRMLLELARRRRILFVGGKGGTGKTSLSSALALARARDGGRVLLVSTDPAHSLGQVWDQSLSDSTTRVVTEAEGFVDAIEVDPRATIASHFATVEKMMYRMLPERQHPAVKQHLETAKSAPGSQESAILERIAQITETGLDGYDLVLFDTAPTGHTVHLLALPERLTSWAESLLANRDRSERFAAAARGLVSTQDQTPTADAELRRTLLARRDRFALMRETITDASSTGFVVVTLAEKLPIAESLDLIEQLEEIGVDLAAVVVNRRSPADAGPRLAERRTREDAHVDQLRTAIDAVPLAQIPVVEREMAGYDELAELADLVVAAPAGATQ